MFQGEGYDCAKDTFNGDGLWSNVAGQREWVESQMMEGLTLGLNPQLRLSVFLDAQASLAPTHVCPSVTLSDFQSVSVSGRPT